MSSPTLASSDLVYCFVHLEGRADAPRIWVVPSQFVADYVTKEHEAWLATKPKRRSEHTMRIFRISAEGSSEFEENWGIFDR